VPVRVGWQHPAGCRQRVLVRLRGCSTRGSDRRGGRVGGRPPCRGAGFRRDRTRPQPCLESREQRHLGAHRVWRDRFVAFGTVGGTTALATLFGENASTNPRTASRSCRTPFTTRPATTKPSSGSSGEPPSPGRYETPTTTRIRSAARGAQHSRSTPQPSAALACVSPTVIVPAPVVNGEASACGGARGWREHGTGTESPRTESGLTRPEPLLTARSDDRGGKATR
jgi:hypothetical protein